MNDHVVDSMSLGGGCCRGLVVVAMHVIQVPRNKVNVVRGKMLEYLPGLRDFAGTWIVTLPRPYPNDRPLVSVGGMTV